MVSNASGASRPVDGLSDWGTGPCAVRLGFVSGGEEREKGAQRTRIKRWWFCRWCGAWREVGRRFEVGCRSGMAGRGCGLGDESSVRGARANNSMKPTTLSRIFLSIVSFLVRIGSRIVPLRQPCGGLSRSRYAANWQSILVFSCLQFMCRLAADSRYWAGAATEKTQASFDAV